MICSKPYMVGTAPFGCGQCLPCRINRRRLWTWRQVMESFCHEQNCFITLTYDDAHLPRTEDGKATLVPDHATLFIKRLRERVRSADERRFRYFLVGEYGDESDRPHYHATLFGLGPLDAPLIQASWSGGFSYTAEFNEKTAQYVCGYVVKKMVAKDHPQLAGRRPEFARMSRRPGIGAAAMAVVAESLGSDAGLDELLRTGDVPHQLKMGRMSIPLGRYLREVLRDEMGVPKEWRERVKTKFRLEKWSEMSSLRDDSKTGAQGYRELLAERDAGKIASIETKAKIFKKRVKL